MQPLLDFQVRARAAVGIAVWRYHIYMSRRRFRDKIIRCPLLSVCATLEQYALKIRSLMAVIARYEKRMLAHSHAVS